MEQKCGSVRKRSPALISSYLTLGELRAEGRFCPWSCNPSERLHGFLHGTYGISWVNHHGFIVSCFEMIWKILQIPTRKSWEVWEVQKLRKLRRTLVHHLCTTCAPLVHHLCTTCAPLVHQGNQVGFMDCLVGCVVWRSSCVWKLGKIPTELWQIFSLLQKIRYFRGSAWSALGHSGLLLFRRFAVSPAPAPDQGVAWHHTAVHHREH